MLLSGAVLVIEFEAPLGVGSARHAAFLVQQIQDAQLALDELDARLIIVEVDHAPVDALGDIFLLL